jgi:hypothetical protein
MHRNFDAKFLIFLDLMKINVLDRVTQGVVLNFPDQSHLFGCGSAFTLKSQVNQHAFRAGPVQSFGDFTTVELQRLRSARPIKDRRYTPAGANAPGTTPADLCSDFCFYS